MGELSTMKVSDWLAPRRLADGPALSPMDRLWNRFDGMYPNRWRAAFANEKAIQNWRESWAYSFEDEAITQDEIATGLRNCRKMFDWPPSLPEFLKACRPPIDKESAYVEAVEQMRRRHSADAKVRAMESWSHPAIFWAAASFGPDLATYRHDQVAGRWSAALDKALEDYKRGGDRSVVPPPRVALPPPESSLTPEQRQEKIDHLKKELGMTIKSVGSREFDEDERKRRLEELDRKLSERGVSNELA